MLFGALDSCAAKCFRRPEDASQSAKGRAGAAASQHEARWFGGLDGCTTRCCRPLEDAGCRDIAVQVSIEGVGDVPPLTLGDERVASPQLLAPVVAASRDRRSEPAASPARSSERSRRRAQRHAWESAQRPPAPADAAWRSPSRSSVGSSVSALSAVDASPSKRDDASQSASSRDLLRPPILGKEAPSAEPASSRTVPSLSSQVISVPESSPLKAASARLQGLEALQKAQADKDAVADACLSVEATLAKASAGLLKAQAAIASVLSDTSEAGASVDQVRTMMEEATKAQRAAAEAMVAWEAQLAEQRNMDSNKMDRASARKIESSREVVGKLASTLESFKNRLSHRSAQGLGTAEGSAGRGKRSKRRAAGRGAAPARGAAAPPRQAAASAPRQEEGGGGGSAALLPAPAPDAEIEEVGASDDAGDTPMVSVKTRASVVDLDWVGADSMPPTEALQTWLSEGHASPQKPRHEDRGKLLPQSPSREESAKLGLERASVLSAPEGDDGGVPPSASVSIVSSRSRPVSERSGEGLQERIASNPDNPQIRVQALINGDWVDSSQREVKQIAFHLAGGESKFTITARGALYVVDFSNPEGATQMNPATGKTRQLRVLELAEDSESSAAEAGDQADGNFKPPIKEPSDAGAALQRQYGPQSKRGAAPQFQLSVLEHNSHARECFARLASNEEALCDEWAVFYHSYSFAALVYEVHAAVAAVLFRFRSEFASLPRLLAGEFATTPNATALLDRFNREFASSSKDHHPAFRKVAISAMCSLVALGPEASTPVVFVAGYSEKDLNFLSVLEGLLSSCYVPKNKVKKLAGSIIALSEQHGLDVSQFGGKPCESRNAGHLLQIFIKRKLVDQLAYASQPYGLLDPDRHPLSEWINGDVNANYGQVRVLAHPKLFMSRKSVRMFVVSADPVFHRNRQKFQEELTKLLDVILGDPALRVKAATGIWGGKLPPWWTSQDQRAHRVPSKQRTSKTPPPERRNLGSLLSRSS